MELNFKDFYSFEEYSKLAEIELVEKNKEKPDYDKLFEQEKSYQVGIVNYLKARAENGMLEMPKNSHTHSANILFIWKNLVEKKLKSHEEEKIIYVFSKLMNNNMMKITYAKEPISIEENYNNLIEKINKGDFDKFELNDEAECFCCGQKIKLIAKDWSFRLFNFKLNDEKKYEATLLPECIENKLYEVNVEFKSGELLIADWFRIEEFTKRVEYNSDYKNLSINSDLGKIQSTEHAAKLGFVTIHVGNRSPQIYQYEEEFIFGHEKEDYQVKDYENKGYVCTDLWNVTIIDKTRLIEIVAETLGNEESIKVVNKYLEEEKGNINFINVQPGKYNIGYSPMKKDINDFDKELPKAIEAIFSMKKEVPKKKLKI